MPLDTRFRKILTNNNLWPIAFPNEPGKVGKIAAIEADMAQSVARSSKYNLMHDGYFVGWTFCYDGGHFTCKRQHGCRLCAEMKKELGLILANACG